MPSFKSLVSLFAIFVLTANAVPLEKRQTPPPACDAAACLLALQAPVTGLSSSLVTAAEACLASATASPTAVLTCLSTPLSSTLALPAVCSACSTVTPSLPVPPNLPLSILPRQDDTAPAAGGLPLIGSLPLGSLGSLLPLSTITGLLGSLTGGLGGTTTSG